MPWILGFSVLGSLGAIGNDGCLTSSATQRGRCTVLAGIVLFFVLEKLVLWRHCHERDCVAHSRPAPLILFGDAFHNFVDGAVIAAAFLSSIPLGVATSLAVVAHEVPQEGGDFGILLDSGYRRGRALPHLGR